MSKYKYDLRVDWRGWDHSSIMRAAPLQHVFIRIIEVFKIMEPCKNGGFELSLQDGLDAFKAAVWPVAVTECRVVVTKNKAWTLFQHH